MENTVKLEDLTKQAFVGIADNTLWLISIPYSDGKLQYNEYILDRGELLTPWRFSSSDFQSKIVGLARSQDLSKVKYQSSLYNELQKRGLVHSAEEESDLLTGGD